ncbi:hypothetical protein [Pseudomonas viridiflava]|uniref:hypothetical protein n=1 Tax=Pseudomonas viridiflava TaxID=33069 RepID=UPI0013D33B9B|nr:hypothetical protein [Pseudomonas viridiflava]MDY0934545.1 hypothetical protein [Pseudomonas viridiflava]MDY1011184.1 hypothetical protein [Pseudomonas viridiflava]
MNGFIGLYSDIDSDENGCLAVLVSSDFIDVIASPFAVCLYFEETWQLDLSR